MSVLVTNGRVVGTWDVLVIGIPMLGFVGVMVGFVPVLVGVEDDVSIQVLALHGRIRVPFRGVGMLDGGSTTIEAIPLSI